MSAVLSDQWQQIAGSSWPVAITLLCFAVALRIYRRSHCHPLLHPLLLSTVLATAIIYLLEIDFTVYFSGNGILLWLVGPATVALAVPLATQRGQLSRVIYPVLSLVLLGGFLATLVALVTAPWLGIDQSMIASVAAKSVTTPIAMGITQQLGGLLAVIVPTVLITGLVGILFADFIFAKFGVVDPRWQGLVLGICCHAIGTARAFEKGPLCGSFATLGMGLNGLWTAFFLPLIAPFFLS